ncbi:3542_t:CDS:2, partial [Gigaspora rosea]
YMTVNSTNPNYLKMHSQLNELNLTTPIKITANKKEQDDKPALPEKVSDIKMFLENINETNTENNDNRQDIQIPIIYYKKISDTINQLQAHFTYRGLLNNILKLPNFPDPDWDIL